jgi:hypothetical protein
MNEHELATLRANEYSSNNAIIKSQKKKVLQSFDRPPGASPRCLTKSLQCLPDAVFYWLGEKKLYDAMSEFTKL